jgi:phosphopantetheine adenylyltransferase
MRTEIAQVKEATDKSHLEEAIEKVMSHVDSHGEAHSTVLERVEYLENFIGESADKHKAIQDGHDEHKTSMETRLEYIEGLIGDSADKHSNELNSAMDKLHDLHAAIASCAKADHASGIEKRIDYLEKFIGEGADNHDNLKTTLEERMEYLEKLLGDSAEGHAKEIHSAGAKMKDLHAAIAACAQKDHHSSLETRLEFLEKEFGQSADKHDTHKTSIETRLEFIEKTMGDSAEKHWKEISDSKGKLGDLHKAIASCAQHDHASGIEQRLEFIEKTIGDDIDKHKKALSTHQKGFKDHAESMETRMKLLESVVGDNADNHSKEIDAAHGKISELNAAIAKCSQKDSHSSLEKRLNFLEKELGQSADKHDTHKTTMEERLEFLETTTGDSAEKHWKEIQSAHGKLGDLTKAIEKCAQKEHHSSLEKRIDFLEKELGQSADNHDTHKTTMEERMEFIEKTTGDSAEKHWKEIQSAHGKLGDLSKAIAQCAQKEHHSSLEQRMAFIEKEFGQSADKHDKHKTTMETRLEFIEKTMGDSADKHWKEIQAAHGKCGDLEKAIAACAKHDHAATIEERVNFLEKTIGDSADKHAKALASHKQGFEEHKTSMETRLKFVEDLLGDTADKHYKEIEAAKKKLGGLEAAVAKTAKSEHHASLEERVEFLEKEFGESADKHSDHKMSFEGRIELVEKQLKKMGDTLDGAGRKSEIEKLEQTILRDINNRLTTVEEKHLQDFVKRLGDYEKKHMSEFSNMQARLGDLDKALKECANIEHYLGLDRKHASLSEQQLKDAEAMRAKHGELQGKTAANEASLDSMARKLGDGLSTLQSKMAALETANSRFKNLFDEVDINIRGEKSSREVGDSQADERIARLEALMNASTFGKDLDLVSGKMRDVMSKIDAQKLNMENFRMLFDQRLAQLEQQLAEETGAQLLKEMDQRFVYLQEDQKRSRDVLESCLTEQIKLEHSAVHSQAAQIKEQWDREVKSRQAYQDSYRELLGQERSAREAQEMHFDNRLQNYERNVYSEIQRLWHELQKEPPQPIVVPQVVEKFIQPPTPTYVMSPRMTPLTSPQLSHRYIPGTTVLPTTFETYGPHSGFHSPAHPMGTSSFPLDMLSGSTGAPTIAPTVVRQYSTGTV